MSTMTYPRVMKRGPFKGRTFDTAKDHAAAKRTLTKGGPGDSFKFVLTVTIGSFESRITGDPRSLADVNRATDLLRTFPS